MPGIRFAAIDAPTPLPHMMMPRSARRPRRAAPDRLGVIGVVDRLVAVRPDVEHLAVLAREGTPYRLLELEAGVIGANRDAHGA